MYLIFLTLFRFLKRFALADFVSILGKYSNLTWHIGRKWKAINFMVKEIGF